MERASAVLAAHLTPRAKRTPGTRLAAQPLPLVSSLALPWRASPLQPPYSCHDCITNLVMNQSPRACPERTGPYSPQTLVTATLVHRIHSGADWHTPRAEQRADDPFRNRPPIPALWRAHLAPQCRVHHRVGSCPRARDRREY